MIDPKTFISNKNKENLISVSGSFFCDKCSQNINEGIMDIDSKKIFWKCNCGMNEANI